MSTVKEGAINKGCKSKKGATANLSCAFSPFQVLTLPAQWPPFHCKSKAMTPFLYSRECPFIYKQQSKDARAREHGTSLMGGVI